MSHAVIIVAGGKGLRMGTDTPKQFLPVGGKPILMHTIERFRQFDSSIRIVLVLPVSQQTRWHDLCQAHAADFCATGIEIADGGETRFHSVLHGLRKTAADVTLIGVHDGVRPFVSTEVIARTYHAAATSGAAIPVIDVFETVRHLHGDGDGLQRESETVPRADYKLVQTPQVFQAGLLRRAYAQPFREAFTDDASVVEALGHSVALVPGNRENIKITTPYDLRVAEALL